MSRKSGANERLKAISEMTLEELRAISDIDMTDRDLAEVIQAIHAGGAQLEDGCNLNSNSAEDPLLSNAWPQTSAQPCGLCAQTLEVPCSQCVLCQASVSNQTLQSIAAWLSWQQQYCSWMVQNQAQCVSELS